MSLGRYLVALGAGKRLPDSLAARLEDGSGLVPAYHEPDAIVLMQASDHRAGTPATNAAGAVRASRVDRGAGRAVIELGWRPGQVTLTMDRTAIAIQRGPAGEAGCLWYRSTDHLLVASDPEMLASARLWRPSVQMAGLAYGLYAASLPSEITGLDGCRELLPGFKLTITDDGRIDVARSWSPWDHVGEVTRATDDVPRFLKQRILDAAANALVGFSRPLVAISGGLDSSILGAALTTRGARPVYVTLATKAPEGDERPYARAVVARLGGTLHERQYRLEDVRLEAAAMTNVPRPSAWTHEQSYYRQVAAVLSDTGCDVLLTGHGGDSLFCLTGSGLALTDRLLAEGLNFGAWRTLRDLVRLTQASPAALVRNASRKLMPGKRSYIWRPDPSFLTPALAHDLRCEPLQHPWLEAPPGALPGRAMHIALLLRAQQAVSRVAGLPIIHVLMTQALMEAVLKIPTWRWVEGGTDRAMARQAFADSLPSIILRRRVKGGPDSFAVALIERFRDSIAERLLEGTLARARLLDRPAVEQALRRFGPGQLGQHVRLLRLLEAESWAQYWQERGTELHGQPSTG